MMETLSGILHTTWLIIVVVLFFNFMIFVHELGHFLAGKWRGAYIDRFQIWFGKPLWKKKIGGVQWGIGWIPAGGFVSLPQLESMEGIEGRADVPEGLKPLKPLDKVIIAAAGPLFSLLLAYAFAVVVWIAGNPEIQSIEPQVGYVAPGSPAERAGILAGDTILAVDGKPVSQWTGHLEGVRELIALSEGERIRLTISRPGQQHPITIESGYELPQKEWWQRQGMRRMGFVPASPAVVGKVHPNSPAAFAGLKEGQRITAVNGQPVYSPLAVLAASKKGTPLQLTVTATDGTELQLSVQPRIPDNWQGLPGATPLLGFDWQAEPARVKMEYPSPQQQVNLSLQWMYDTLKKICAPGSSVKMEHLSGPVGIGNYIYRMMEAGEGIGWRLALWFAVVLNVNLAVLNILPLPVVDGGHVTLGIIEMLRGKPVSGRFLGWIMTAFIFLLFAFFIFVTFKDVGDMIGDSSDPPALPAPIFRVQ